jgi:hypothetical protein
MPDLVLTPSDTLAVDSDNNQIVLKHQSTHGLVEIDLFAILEAIDTLHAVHAPGRFGIDPAELVDSMLADVVAIQAEEEVRQADEREAATRAEALGDHRLDGLHPALRAHLSPIYRG